MPTEANTAPERIWIQPSENNLAGLGPIWFTRQTSETDIQYRRVDPPAAPTENPFVCGPARPDDGSECVYGVCPRPRDGCSQYCWQHHASQCTKVTAPAPAEERDKALARELIGNVNNYSDEHTGELSISAFGPLSQRIATALATVRAEVWRDAMKIIDDAGEGWGVQARDRKSKTYSAYVIAALDLKGRFDESARTGKVEG